MSRAVRGRIFALGNPLIRSIKQGIKRAHAEKGTQQRVRRPLTWGMLAGMQEKGGMDRLGVIVFSDVAGIGNVRGGVWGVSQYLWFAERGRGILQKE